MCVCVYVCEPVEPDTHSKILFSDYIRCPIKLYATILNPLNKMWFIFYIYWVVGKKERDFTDCVLEINPS